MYNIKIIYPQRQGLTVFSVCHVEQLTSLYHSNVLFVLKASGKAFMAFSPWT